MSRQIEFFIGWIAALLFGCHPPPPASPPSVPPPVEEEPPPPVIPEVVKNDFALAAADKSGCNRYTDAAEQIWGYRVQADLQLSVQIYQGKILAADAEGLMTQMNLFIDGWTARFEKLCADDERDALAATQFLEGATCLKELLDVQKDYVNELFHSKTFTVDAAAAVATRVTDCDNILMAKGSHTY
ncbi:MAG: hypothetical protein JXR45_09060 [Deltaproteobacteria bacterium]|nr:hypothetical protein [Deltaproteobacteria bacterium]